VPPIIYYSDGWCAGGGGGDGGVGEGRPPPSIDGVDGSG